MVFGPKSLPDHNMTAEHVYLSDRLCLLQNTNLKVSKCNTEKVRLKQLLKPQYTISVSSPRDRMHLL